MKRFDGRPVDRGLLLRMRDTMTHRGPDGAGLHVDGSVGLGHRRLSIVDLSVAGHQPMCNEDGSIWLVFNGEIYNYVELREQLRSRGHRFRSTSDSEVIIHLYEERGQRCVHDLNGMFSFVIWDSGRRAFFGARDRFGIKPFYYYRDDQQLVCASEIKAILEDPAVPRAPDTRGIADYVFAGAPLAGKTFFAGISQLSPGHSIWIGEDRVSVEPYWDLSFEYRPERSPEKILAEVSDLLDDAVRIQCRSDVPLGAHLSGGLDSSAVSGLAARHVDRLKTFSIRFDVPGDLYDETPYARMVSEAIGSEFVNRTATGAHLVDLYPSLLWHMDQPTAGRDAGFSYYAAAELASEHVKVALTGHGGDEVFAGYPAQFKTAFGTTESFASRQIGDAPRMSRIGRLARVLRAEGITGGVRRLVRRLRPEPQPTPEELWTRLHCGATPERDLSLHPRFLDELAGYSPLPDYLQPFRQAPTDQLLDRCLYHDLRVYLPHLLHKEDRASMAVSIESRVPLLDHRIAEYMATIPPHQKVPALEPKVLLRQAAAPYIPEEVRRRRDKVPFAIPMRHWMTSLLAPIVGTVLNSPQCLERGVFNPDLIRNGSLTDKERLTILNVELWFRLFIDREPEWRDRTGVARSGTAKSRDAGSSPHLTPTWPGTA